MWKKLFGLFKKRKNKENEQKLSGDVPVDNAAMKLVSEDTLCVLRSNNLLVEKERLRIADIIGKGHVGCVYRGYLASPDKKSHTLVAVKTLHQNSPRNIDLDERSFVDEALMMKEFQHKNVMTLMGLCFGVEALPLLILPFMQHRDLLSYIRNKNNSPKIKDLIIFGVDISCGMEYLANEKFVHRDLAARNCMLDGEFTVKVADFGLSRDIFGQDYYLSDNKKNKLPVKWLAPECLEKGKFSSESDVWSFGVLLWELMTRGVIPYAEVDNWDLLAFIREGRRMTQPPCCPDSLYNIMMKCWDFDPKKRPTFLELVTEIRNLIKELEQQMKRGRHRTNIEHTYVNIDACAEPPHGDFSNLATAAAPSPPS